MWDLNQLAVLLFDKENQTVDFSSVSFLNSFWWEKGENKIGGNQKPVPK